MATRHALASLLVLAVAGSAGLSCALIAGLSDYHPAGTGGGGTGGAGSGGGNASASSTTSTSTSTSTATGSGSGSGGSTPGVPGRWPDSASFACLDGMGMAFTSSCTDSTSPTYGQDGSFEINRPTYTPVPGVEMDAVTDNVTGLAWLRKALPTTTWSLAVTACEGTTVGPMTWRLPTRLELVSILDSGQYDPDLDTTAFTDVADGDFWTTSPGPGGTKTWFLRLSDGEEDLDPPDATHFQLCVSGPVMQGKLSVVDETTALDSRTGLLWQRGSALATHTWAKALQTCENLNGAASRDATGWRLPTEKELLTIVDETSTPAIDPNVFSTFDATTPYWTASPYSTPMYVGTAYGISFVDGTVQRYDISTSFAVRCVKTMP